MPVIGTTAQMVITGTPQNPVTFELHADADNTDTINYSMQDPTVTDQLGELLAGQSLFIDEFVGALYIKGEASGLTYGIPILLYKSSLRDGGEIAKA